MQNEHRPRTPSARQASRAALALGAELDDTLNSLCTPNGRAFAAWTILYLAAWALGVVLVVMLHGWPLLQLLGVGLSATVGQIFLTKAFTVGPPAQLSVVGLSQVVFALLLEVVLWGRSPGLLSLRPAT